MRRSSRGCHVLIRQGAKLVESPEDVMEEFGLSCQPGNVTEPAPSWNSDDADSDPLLAVLTHDPAALDTLCERSGQAPETLATSGCLNWNWRGARNVYRGTSSAVCF
ncbi:hypothetical protein ACTMU2_37880 [Cupriavidus basilensis]